jgi:hypothetical protein
VTVPIAARCLVGRTRESLFFGEAQAAPHDGIPKSQGEYPTLSAILFRLLFPSVESPRLQRHLGHGLEGALRGDQAPDSMKLAQ